MENAFVPGPWRIVPNTPQEFVNKSKNRVGHAICGVEKAMTTISIHAEPDEKPCREIARLDALGEANARLICAAPDLLACMVAKLEYDVTPLEWISALLADYKTLREMSEIESIDPEAEALCLSNVRHFLNEAAAAVKKATTPETT